MFFETAICGWHNLGELRMICPDRLKHHLDARKCKADHLRKLRMDLWGYISRTFPVKNYVGMCREIADDKHGHPAKPTIASIMGVQITEGAVIVKRGDQECWRQVAWIDNTGQTDAEAFWQVGWQNYYHGVGRGFGGSPWIMGRSRHSIIVAWEGGMDI